MAGIDFSKSHVIKGSYEVPSCPSVTKKAKEESSFTGRPVGPSAVPLSRLMKICGHWALRLNCEDEDLSGVVLAEVFGREDLKSWGSWVDRLDPIFGDMWDSWGIRYMIMLSKVIPSQSSELAKALLGFWSSHINAFVLQFGILTPTVLDVSVILGLLVGEVEPHFSSFYTVEPLAMPSPYDSNNKVVDLLQSNRVLGSPSPEENIVLLFFWFNRFFACFASKGFLREVFFVSA
ncbi:uncharacterized protein LOC127252708 isoform X1 [Andrographis paniculata]|uniref:uncharacterized protein LOC127252708 isoform X1 n=1 Tax=Andrographis paniculata TaxID=175694 RepID=UPI0021E71966|nr:uncharacterized protein LOC127252708 isoform X1 [Andrographis paniculata]